MKHFFFAVLVIATLVVSSQTACYYDNEVEQYGISICDTVAISFSQDIQPIINARCVSCHAPGGQQPSSPYTSYDAIKVYDASIVERVNGIGNSMPPTGAISDCEIHKLEAWVNAGSPNN